jgi:hypothetical protein
MHWPPFWLQILLAEFPAGRPPPSRDTGLGTLRLPTPPERTLAACPYGERWLQGSR